MFLNIITPWPLVMQSKSGRNAEGDTETRRANHFALRDKGRAFLGGDMVRCNFVVAIVWLYMLFLFSFSGGPRKCMWGMVWTQKRKGRDRRPDLSREGPTVWQGLWGGGEG